MATTDEYLTPGSYSWLCPTGVSSVYVEVFGGGGGGGYGDNVSNITGGGGGAGGSSTKTFAVTAGNSYTVEVGNSGSGATFDSDGGAGGQSYFNNTSTCRAYGGNGGFAGSVGGSGGSGGAAGTGDTTFSGNAGNSNNGGGYGVYGYGGDGGNGFGFSNDGTDGGTGAVLITYTPTVTPPQQYILFE